MQTPEAAWAEARKTLRLSELARKLKTSRQAVHAWTRVPEDRVRVVARLVGRRPEDLRPDLYPAEPWSSL